jgi:glycosyltransferase involved in cell wall biosynthesis
MDKIKVLVLPSDKFGCGYYRSLKPHTKLSELYEDEFDVDIKYELDVFNVDALSKYDIIHFHKGLYTEMDAFRNALIECKNRGTTIVLDLDDYWDLDTSHPAYADCKNASVDTLIKENMKIADYVTTTTDILAKEIAKYNPNVKIFANAIDKDEEQFKDKTIPSKRLRFGFVMGSSHLQDMEMLRGMTNSLPKDILDKIQFVLCGYDLRGTVTYNDANGEIYQRPLLPKESVWYEYECILTDNYRLVSPEYKEWLNRFIPNASYPFEDDEPYKRRWTKGIMSYCTHYNDIDVLMVPLENTLFNSCKSELKLIEAGMMNKAAIVSNFGPYKIGTVNFFEKGGAINPEGNCILIDRNKAHKDWAKTIEKLVKNPDYIEMLRNNLHNSIKDKYDLVNVTRERAEWYKSILKRG